MIVAIEDNFTSEEGLIVSTQKGCIRNKWSKGKKAQDSRKNYNLIKFENKKNQILISNHTGKKFVAKVRKYKDIYICYSYHGI